MNHNHIISASKRELFILVAGIAVGAFGFYMSVRPQLEQLQQFEDAVQAFGEAFTVNEPTPEEIESSRKLDAKLAELNARADAQWERINEEMNKL